MSSRQIGREVAYRVFASEFNSSSVSYTESDEERAPNYVVTPTGALVNRLFVIGTLTEVTRINDEMVRARIVDPTGAFVVYAGQYQPNALAFLEEAEPPAFVAITGKARTFQADDSDVVYTSIRPERITAVDGDTRDRWVVDTAERTLGRIEAFATASTVTGDRTTVMNTLLENDYPTGLAKGIPLAREKYGTTPGYLADLHSICIDAITVIAGEQDSVTDITLTVDGDDETDEDFSQLSTGEMYTIADSDLSPESPTHEEVPESPSEEETEPLSEPNMESEGDSMTDDQEDDASVDDVPVNAVDTDSEPAMYNMDDSEREQIEAEYGAEFSTGTDIETDESDHSDIAQESPQIQSSEESEQESESDQPDADSDDETSQSIDLSEVAVDTMRELNTGDGVEREDIIEHVVAETAATVEEVNEAINEALMNGQCYEPESDILKPI